MSEPSSPNPSAEHALLARHATEKSARSYKLVCVYRTRVVFGSCPDTPTWRRGVANTACDTSDVWDVAPNYCPCFQTANLHGCDVETTGPRLFWRPHPCSCPFVHDHVHVPCPVHEHVRAPTAATLHSPLTPTPRTMHSQQAQSLSLTCTELSVILASPSRSRPHVQGNSCHELN